MNTIVVRKGDGMLTPERQKIILDLLQVQEIVKIQELIDITGASESTIRRDLSQLEQEKKLKRVHGGASRLHQKGEELSIQEKSSQNLTKKKEIAELAASIIEDGDCIYIDAGTTTLQLITKITKKNITVVTNGFAHIQILTEKGIPTYVVGGYMKPKTGAIVGSKAVESLSSYYFDKAFIGANGAHPTAGYTTPDPEEANVKQLAIKQSRQAYVLIDDTKMNDITFIKIADLKEATIITNQIEKDVKTTYEQKTTVMVVQQ